MNEPTRTSIDEFLDTLVELGLHKLGTEKLSAVSEAYSKARKKHVSEILDAHIAGHRVNSTDLDDAVTIAKNYYLLTFVKEF